MTKIGIDIDGVVADFMCSFLKYLPKGTKVSDIVDYNFDKFNLSHKQIFNILEGWEKTGDYTRIKPIDGAVRGVNEIYNYHKVNFITARNQYDSLEKETESWLIDNGFMFDSLVMSRNKLKTIQNGGVSLMIEDNPFELMRLANSGVECICYDRPYNCDIEHSLIKRVENWKEIVEYLG